MNRDSVNWTGAMPAITTPFDDGGRIDERELGDVIERHLALGATGVVVGGCTGEFWAMTAEERSRLFAASKAVIGTRGTLIAGTGMIGAEDTIALTTQAEKAGCDGALILPPSSNGVVIAGIAPVQFTLSRFIQKSRGHW
jgi:dihydrodipicolinate synthase/N-acetylneuraminate lyase